MFFAGIASALNLSQTNMLQCNDTIHTVALLVDLTKQGAVINTQACLMHMLLIVQLIKRQTMQSLLAVEHCYTAQQALSMGAKVHNSTAMTNL